MKKELVFVVFFLLMMNILFVIGEPTNVSDEQYNNIQKNIDQIPIDDSGQINNSKLNESITDFKSKAEERVDKINSWIAENASWLGFIFRMIPEISWLFVWNIFIIIVALTYMVFNSHRTWFFIEDEVRALVFGIVTFLILLVTNIYLYIAKGVVYTMDVFWNTIVPWGFWISIILMIIFIVVLVVLAIFAPEVLIFLGRWIARLFGKKFASSSAEAGVRKATQEALNVARKGKELAEKNKAFSDAAFSNAA